MKPIFFYRIKDKFINIGADLDRLAPDQKHAIEYAYKNINAEPERKNEDNTYSLEYCLATSGESINERYRSGCITVKDKEIAEMISQHTIKEDLVLYRGAYEFTFELMKKNAKHYPDCDLYEKGFLATSLVKGHELKFTQKMRILVPKGSHAVYLGNVNDEQHLYEVVIQHGAKLKIISIDSAYINCRLLDTG